MMATRVQLDSLAWRCLASDLRSGVGGDADGSERDLEEQFDPIDASGVVNADQRGDKIPTKAATTPMRRVAGRLIDCFS